MMYLKFELFAAFTASDRAKDAEPEPALADVMFLAEDTCAAMPRVIEHLHGRGWKPAELREALLGCARTDFAEDEMLRDLFDEAQLKGMACRIKKLGEAEQIEGVVEESEAVSL
jgi:hypothetical protein